MNPAARFSCEQLRGVPPVSPSGIDYLRLVDAAHQQHLATQINYAALADDATNTP